MTFFFDTEFTGLHKDTTLISIGITNFEGSRVFYAELTDYDIEQVDDWIRENVINNLILIDKDDSYCEYISDTKSIDGLNIPETLEDVCLVKGNKEFVRNKLIAWFTKCMASNNDTIVQMVSDVSHYDFVLFIDLFGGAMDLPEWICPACYDINQEIAKHNNVTPMEAFNISREGLITNSQFTDLSMKHNALFDAVVIGCIFHRYNIKNYIDRG